MRTLDCRRLLGRSSHSAPQGASQLAREETRWERVWLRRSEGRKT